MSRYIPNELTGVLAPINAELEKIQIAFIDTLSRKGDTPNVMEGSLDLNGQRLFNLADASNAKEPATLSQLNKAIQDLDKSLRDIIEGIIEGTLPSVTDLTPEQQQEIVTSVTDNVINSTVFTDLSTSIVNTQGEVQSLDQELTDLIGTVQTELNQAVASLDTDVQALDTQLQQSVSTLTTNLNTETLRINQAFGELDSIDTALLNETTARTNADSALSTSITGLTSQYNTLNSALLTEQTTRASADAALAQTINTLQTLSARIFVQDTAPTIAVAPDNAVEGDLWYDSDDGNHPYTLLDVSGTLTWVSIRDQIFQALQSQIQTEQTARIDGDTALASDITSLTTTVNTNNTNTLAAIQTEETARTTADTALSNQISTLTADVSTDIQNVTAQITAEATTRATEDTALATSVSNLTSVVNSNNTAALAAVQDEATTRATEDTALASSISSLSATVDSNTAAISTEATARADADSALSTQITTLAAARNKVFYQAEPPIAVSVGDLWFDSNDNNKPYRWSGTAWVDITDGRTTANAAAIVSEQTARISADNALATDIQTLISSTNNNTSAITSEATTRANADSALSSSITALTSTVNSNTAAIQTEQTARATADTAIANSVTTLSSTVNNNTAAIQTTQSVVDGLTAQYMVKLDVNGFVSGFGLYNEGSSSEFVVLADKFAVVTPGATPVVPFRVTVDGVFIKDAFIENLNASKINGQLVRNQLEDNIINGVKLEDGAVTADKIFANSVTADKIQANAVTANKILAGSVTGDKISSTAIDGKVIKGATFITTEVGQDSVEVKSGTPFGVSGNLFEWYGLKVNGVTWNNTTNEPITSGMSTVNSKFHKTVDGKIYFGGTFQAGTLSNSTTNTQLLTTSIADLGAFSSNGGQIQVTGSFSYAASTFGTGTCPTGTETTGTLFIERLVSGSWVIVSQVSIPGTYNCLEESGEYISEWSSGASVTYTDSDLNTTTRQYRARAVVNALPGTQRNKALTVVSAEE